MPLNDQKIDQNAMVGKNTRVELTKRRDLK